MAKMPQTCRSHSWLTSKVSNNDPRVRNAMLIGIYAFNNQSNDKFLFKVSHIKDAHIQIVKGIKFLLEANISRTVCLKREPSPDLDKCNFQPLGKLHKVRCINHPLEHGFEISPYISTATFNIKK
uniref:Cystatin domain-containing protein n=1 Tax=Scleropages formosus TaxID=113540 RepID=A0A8C9S5C8_SCLFO